MLLGGLWHGAGWTFVIWGGLHGIYLVIHQSWQTLRERWFGRDLSRSRPAARFFSVFITFLGVVVAWVFFRATSLAAALSVLQGMIGANGVVFPLEWQGLFGSLSVPEKGWLSFGHLEAFGGTRQLLWIALLLAIVWAGPNSQALIERLRARRGHERWAWMSLGSLAVVIFLLAAINGSHGSSEFIYFNF